VVKFLSLKLHLEQLDEQKSYKIMNITSTSQVIAQSLCSMESSPTVLSDSDSSEYSDVEETNMDSAIATIKRWSRNTTKIAATSCDTAVAEPPSPPLSVCTPHQLSTWLEQKASSDKSNSLIILDIVSSDTFPEHTIPGAVCVRTNAFDIYHYEKDASSSDSDTAGDDDPSDSGRVQQQQQQKQRQKQQQQHQHQAACSASPKRTAKLPIMTYGNFNLRKADELRNALEALGVQHTTPVVVLTQNFKAGAADPISAARVAWLLCYCGVHDVRILNGGFGAWQRAGNHVVSVTNVEDNTTLLAPNAARVDFFNQQSKTFPARPEFLATTEEVSRIVNKEQRGVLADARSWNEYLGKMHGYNFDLGCGRIPGARWAHWGPNTYRGGDFSKADSIGMLCDVKSIETFWKDWNILPQDQDDEKGRAIVFYCGSGWRSAMAWVMSQLLGLKHCKSYDGGFLEWNKLHPNAGRHLVEEGLPTIVPSGTTTTSCR